LIENTEADAYATSLPEAVQLCMKAAKGELKEAVVEPTPPPAPDKAKRREPRRKSQSAAA
jgi:hypothetical protein